MADEAGQTALYGVTQDRDALDARENGHARALWMFLNDPDAFRHAEEVRFTDERRRGRMWDGFIGRPGLTLQRDPTVLDRFKAAVRERFQSKNVHVDIFDRQASQTIWQMAADHFGSTNPLLGGWVITQAKLTIRFQPEAGARRGRTLPLTVTMPHGCDLKDRTERERMIGEKYLRRWYIVEDV